MLASNSGKRGTFGNRWTRTITLRWACAHAVVSYCQVLVYLHMNIVHTEAGDLNQIFEFFEDSVRYQEQKGYPVWRNYDKQAIVKDVAEKNQYKVMVQSQMGIVFSVGYTDPIIWRERDQGRSVYLHRIVVNPEMKGKQLFGAILNWAIEHARQKGLQSVRMDTWASNPTIISYYQRFGFAVVENFTTPDSEELPVHNRNLALTLLEYKI